MFALQAGCESAGGASDQWKWRQEFEYNPVMLEKGFDPRDLISPPRGCPERAKRVISAVGRLEMWVRGNAHAVTYVGDNAERPATGKLVDAFSVISVRA
jgi:hypothetical protein